MMGQSLCDGNVIVNLYGQLTLWCLDALQFLKHTLGFYLYSSPQIIAAEQEGLISTPKWTGNEKEKQQAFLEAKAFFYPKVSSHIANISHLTSKNRKQEGKGLERKTIMFRLRVFMAFNL